MYCTENMVSQILTVKGISSRKLFILKKKNPSMGLQFFFGFGCFWQNCGVLSVFLWGCLLLISFWPRFGMVFEQKKWFLRV